MEMSKVFKRLLLAELNALPPQQTGRPSRLAPEDALDHIFKLLRTGMQWREVNAAVSFTNLFRRFHKWVNAGIFENAYKKALRTYRRLVPSEYYCIDSSYVKNRFGRVGVGKNHTDRGRKALKLSVITDQNGVCQSVTSDPGNRPDVTLLTSSLQGALLQLDQLPLYADRGYDSRANRVVCQRFGLKDRIFRRRTKTVRRTNAKRIVVEHAFAWIQQFRRLLCFYEQTPPTYIAFVLCALGHRLCTRHLISSLD